MNTNSGDMILAGADMIKTSTGKFDGGATISAATAILNTIKDVNVAVGFKASGGISTPEDAMQYLELANTIMGPDWVSPNTFRIGSSRLI